MFLFSNLPSALFSGLKVKYVDAEKCKYGAFQVVHEEPFSIYLFCMPEYGR
jgi:hypothetical protein